MSNPVTTVNENSQSNGSNSHTAEAENSREVRPLEIPVTNLEDHAAPSKEISSARQRISDIFTIFCAGFALISDGYQNNLMTMTNVVLRAEYPKQYTPYYSTAVSNALLVGEMIGQITIGLTCDYLGRKVAIVLTTLMIVIGGILATASSGYTIEGMFWMLIIARGVVGFG